MGLMAFYRWQIFCFYVLMYSSETMIWKKRSRIKTVQMDNLKDLLGIRRLDRVPNAWIRGLLGFSKEVDETKDEGVLR